MVEENKVLGIKQNSTLNIINKAVLSSIIMCKYRHSYAGGSFTSACLFFKPVSVSIGHHTACQMKRFHLLWYRRDHKIVGESSASMYFEIRREDLDFEILTSPPLRNTCLHVFVLSENGINGTSWCRSLPSRALYSPLTTSRGG